MFLVMLFHKHVPVLLPDHTMHVEDYTQPVPINCKKESRKERITGPWKCDFRHSEAKSACYISFFKKMVGGG